jgi:hypothetical protein
MRAGYHLHVGREPCDSTARHATLCTAGEDLHLALQNPGSSSGRLAAQRAHARILDARGCAGMRLSAHLWMSARERVLAAAPQWARGRQPHIAVVYHIVSHCLAAARCRKRSSTCPSSGWCRSDDASAVPPVRQCALAQTDACPDSSSAARNSGPMGLDNVDHQRQLQILAASLPLAWMSLRARRRTVARSAVARFSADMEVITCAHVHVQGLKQLTCCPFTRSSIKRVDPCTGSLASPLHALSPSSSSTFKYLRTRAIELGT